MKTHVLRATLSVLFAAVAAVGGGSAVSAAPVKASAPVPAFTSIDPCALNGGGVLLGDSGTCLKITGGVSFTQSWGNASGGYLDAPGGQPIVTTPSGTYTIPAPR